MVAVLGASDRRYIPIHERIFSAILQKEIILHTLDIETEHLSGKSGVIQHDVTTPFPHRYSIIFSHELMKFLSPEEQLLTILNSCQALTSPGLAMHIIHEPSIKGTPELRAWQYRVDPDDLIVKLKNKGIPAEKLYFESGSTIDWLKDTTVLVIKK